jgi:metal transporter CNNM
MYEYFNTYYSLDETNLRILKRSGTPQERHYAEQIEPIRKNTHLLLVTLLLANTIVNETLPVLFHTVQLEGYQAVLFSTVLVVIFGE